ncbi:hypothetical protein KX928_11960 [Roseobacter sp. YSTF-M11]|uniref:Uncharacterized protein n=1 Tax=Roseobacter insulae TaxID=2859783 RepID=A0A9X1FVM6_9RHOB|nr:hypothetical protein [Roseobacter insulae]MBW4708498.1 hypothetical protein [Roseobacter insulae]
MRALMTAALAICPFVVSADAWKPLTGEEIRSALTDRKLQYANASQDFRASGRTLYNAGADSWGNWRVAGDQYCSQWPPSDLWACYDMARAGDRLRFIGQGDDITDAVYAD